MAAQYIPIKRVSSLDVPITAEKLDGSLFTTENQAHEFIISVRKNGVKQTVTGGVTGKFIRSNGTTIFLQGSISNGDAVVRLHQDCYNVQGRFTFNIFNSQLPFGNKILSYYDALLFNLVDNVVELIFLAVSK